MKEKKQRQYSVCVLASRVNMQGYPNGYTPDIILKEPELVNEDDLDKVRADLTREYVKGDFGLNVTPEGLVYRVFVDVAEVIYPGRTLTGFKAFNKHMISNTGFQYELGKEYEMDELPIPCNRGFHFCGDPRHCFIYYDRDDSIMCKVEASGIILDGYMKYVTNKIKIKEPIVFPQNLFKNPPRVEASLYEKDDNTYAKLGKSMDKFGE